MPPISLTDLDQDALRSVQEHVHRYLPDLLEVCEVEVGYRLVYEARPRIYSNLFLILRIATMAQTTLLVIVRG